MLYVIGGKAMPLHSVVLAIIQQEEKYSLNTALFLDIGASRALLLLIERENYDGLAGVVHLVVSGCFQLCHWNRDERREP